MSLYDEIGGAAAVKAAVDVFYAKVLNDSRIRDFFTGVEMESQKAKQRAFLAMAFGAPTKYDGRDMTTSHAPLVARGLNDSHVDAVIENLGATLVELGVPAPLIAKAAAIAESVRDDVLGRVKVR